MKLFRLWCCVLLVICLIQFYYCIKVTSPTSWGVPHADENAVDLNAVDLMMRVRSATTTREKRQSPSNTDPSALVDHKRQEENLHQIFQNSNEDITRRNDQFQFQYKDPLNKFPLPQWLEDFLNSQPSETHNETLADPNEKFIVMTCHKYKSTVFESCGGIADRLFLIPYYIWLANKTGRKLLM